MVDLGGYVIILVETHDKRVKLYGSPAEKADLEVADEILEINGQSLENSSHTDIIAHIHNCIKSRTICLRVKRRTGNKLAKELAENSHVQDAFVIAVEQQAKERLERLSALRKIKPVDMSTLSQQLCDSPPGENDDNSIVSGGSTIYSTPVAQLGSTNDLANAATSPPPIQNQQSLSTNPQSKSSSSTNNKSNSNNVVNNIPESSKNVSDSQQKTGNQNAMKGDLDPQQENHNPTDAYSSPQSQRRACSAGQDDPMASGYLTDEELELCHTVEQPLSAAPTSLEANKSANNIDQSNTVLRNKTANSGNLNNVSAIPVSESSYTVPTTVAESITSPSVKEVLIGGDNNPSRRSSRSSMGNYAHLLENNKNGDKGKHVNNGSRVQRDTISKAKEAIVAEAKDEGTELMGEHASLAQTLSLKSVVDAEEMLQCMDRVQKHLTSANVSIQDLGSLSGQRSVPEDPQNLPRAATEEGAKGNGDSKSLVSAESLIRMEDFRRLLKIHNKIQAVQCFQYPPNALCCDSKELVRECLVALQNSPLPEAAEIQDILQQIEFDGLFYTHDRLAERQAARPWEQCVAEMWNNDRPTGSKAIPSPSPQPQSSESTLERVSNKQVKGNTPQPQSFANANTPANNTAKIMNSYELDSIRGSQQISPAPQAQSRDVTRVVKILKQNEPLGATVRNEGDRVVIGRVVKGGAAERSGQLHPGDEVLEVNGLKLKGKSVHDICDTLCQMTGTLTFVIIPKPLKASNHPIKTVEPSFSEDEEEGRGDQVYHYRAHFSYHPDDDLYIPCHELGISFQRGDILHVINREDQHWWQAYRDGEWTQTLAGLIPSLTLQQHRVSLQRQKREQNIKEQREQERNSPAKKKSSAASSLLCAKKSNKRKRLNSPFKRAERFDIPPYEEMALYYPQANQRRPLILVGPPSIGRHELRLRLLEDTSRFAAAVPHTSRPKSSESEIDGQDYNFVSRAQFEEYVSSKRFVEHGEYDKQYYGTSLDAVRTVINSGKICVLNLQPSSLQILHESDLKPYVVFLTPPTLQTYRQQKQKYGELFKEDEFRDSVAIAQDMEDHYGHYFDSVIPFDDVDYVYQQLMYEINLLEREPQWVPAKWVVNVATASN